MQKPIDRKSIAMFALEKVQYSKTGVECLFAFKCPGLNDQVHKMTLSGAVEDVQREYLKNAVDYISYAFDQLIAEVATLRPHFFDPETKPYYACSGFWRQGFWKLIDNAEAFRKALARRHLKEVLEIVVKMDLHQLDPCEPFTNQASVQELIADINNLAKECYRVYSKLK